MPFLLCCLMRTLVSEYSGLKCPPKLREDCSGSPSSERHLKHHRYHPQPHTKAPTLWMAPRWVPVSWVRPWLGGVSPHHREAPHRVAGTGYHDQSITEALPVTSPSKRVRGFLPHQVTSAETRRGTQEWKAGSASLPQRSNHLIGQSSTM